MVEANKQARTRRNKDPRFKTMLCKNFAQNNQCPYGRKCLFAHGHHELRPRPPPEAAAATTNAVTTHHNQHHAPASRQPELRPLLNEPRTIAAPAPLPPGPQVPVPTQLLPAHLRYRANSTPLSPVLSPIGTPLNTPSARSAPRDGFAEQLAQATTPVCVGEPSAFATEDPADALANLKVNAETGAIELTPSLPGRIASFQTMSVRRQLSLIMNGDDAGAEAVPVPALPTPPEISKGQRRSMEAREVLGIAPSNAT